MSPDLIMQWITIILVCFLVSALIAVAIIAIVMLIKSCMDTARIDRELREERAQLSRRLRGN